MIKLILPMLFAMVIIYSPASLSAKEKQTVEQWPRASTRNTSWFRNPENGGNAFDAAVAVASTLNVVEPAMSGLGGYGSTLIYDVKKKEIRYLNSSGRFPLATNSDLMREPTADYLQNRKGPKSISTPGNLNAWHEMHKTYGKLPWNGFV